MSPAQLFPIEGLAAITNNPANTVSVLLGDGSGTFAARTDFSTGLSPFKAVPGDFNEDGNADIVVCNVDDDNVSILLGNGSGGFAPRVNYTAGNAPAAVAVGDFNLDGHQDLVTTNFFAASISILRGNGNGTFQPKVDSAVGSNPKSLTLAYLNGDNILDLAVANSSPSTISVRMGNGTGGFGTKIDYATGTSPQSIRAADLNIDGKVDLVTANANQDNVSVLLNSGTGTFPTRTNTTVGGGPYAVEIADLTDDGEPDIVTGNYFVHSVSVLHGQVPGGFRVNAQAPPLKAFNQSGVSDSLSHYLGKWVILDMCANWCPHCNFMADEAQLVYDTWVGHPTVQVEYLTCLADGPTPGLASTQADAASWASEHNLSRPILHDSGLQQSLVRAYNVAIGTNAFPTILIIDPTGKIVFRQAGGFTGETLVAKIAAFAGVAVPPLAPGLGPPPPPPPAPLHERAMTAATIELSYGASTWTGSLTRYDGSDDLRISYLGSADTLGFPGVPGFQEMHGSVSARPFERTSSRKSRSSHSRWTCCSRSDGLSRGTRNSRA